MVKAKKRRKTGKEIKLQKKKDRKIKIGTMFVLVLLFLGFTVAAYWGFSPQNTAPEEPVEDDNMDFGTGFPAGTGQATVEELTGNRALFGQLEVPQDLSGRLEGDLYLLDNGLSQLILTNASEDEISDEARGDFIIYTVGVCEDFDCLITNMTNETMVFDLYELDEDSAYLRTSTIGFESEHAMGIEL